MAERKIKVPQTKGSFQLKGIVTGTDKDNFYNEKMTKTGNEWRLLNFGLEVEEGETVYATIQGFQRQNVCFYKRAEEKNGKGTTEKVAWEDRLSFNKPGYKLIGVNVGVSKVVNEKGKTVNDKKTLTEFDATKVIAEHLTDGDDVFVRGNLEFGSYTDNGGNTKRTTRFVPNQVSLCKKIEFGEDYVPVHDFTQTVIFMGIEKEKDDSGAETGRFAMQAKVVNYSDIQDTELIIENAKLANVIRKNLKPYNSINVWGKINVSTPTEEVENDDIWGEENEMKKVSAPTIRELVITGADPASIDTETFSQEQIDSAIEALKAKENAENDYGVATDDSWGADVTSTFTEDEDEDWG